MTTSDAYTLLREAIADKRQAHFMYKGHRRETCPHAIGTGPNKNEQVLVYQFGGSSSSGGSIDRVPDEQRWRCLALEEISQLTIEDGPWHTAANHTQRSNCLKWIDLEVKPASDDDL